MLSSVGITEEWYKEAKGELGYSPTCNCQDRVEWLNRAHKWWLRKLGKEV